MKFSKSKKRLLYLCASGLIVYPVGILAEDSGENVQLDTITVQAKNETAKEFKPGGARYVIDEDYIKYAPSATNNVNDLLRGKSSIQFDQTSRSSVTAGEIAPPKISIHGSKHYENSFLINGVGNNNNINPSGLIDGEYTTQQPSGEAQTLFLDTSLLETVNVYTESISAEYGGFLGGVIDSKLKDADKNEWHMMIKGRYTKDSWAKFNWTEQDEKDMNSTTKIVKPQLEFTKYEYSVAVNGPINDYFGLTASYGKQNSNIPYLTNHYGFYTNGTNYRVKTDHRRENDNYLLRLNTSNFDGFKADLTTIYAPYKATSSIPNYENSNYYTKGGGYNLIYDMTNDLKFGSFKNTLSYQKNELSRTAGKYTWAWNRAYGDFPWAISPTSNSANEGGFGSYTQDKEDVGYKGVLSLDKMDLGSTSHLIKLGLEAQYVHADGYRSDYYTYALSGAQQDSTAQGSKEDGVLEGSQWFNRRTVAVERDRDVYFHQEALFLQDTIKIDRFTVRPGVRISTDSITNNVDIAYRLFANADVFNDDAFNIYGGLNRYYGSQILSHALHFPTKVYQQTRAHWSQDWVNSTAPSNNGLNNLGDLETPYSDEYHIGTSVDMFDTNFKIDFVNRDYKKQIRSQEVTIPAPRHSEFTNAGSSNYKGITLAISKEYDLGYGGKHFSVLSATKSRTKTDGVEPLSSYAEDIDSDYSLTHVTYDGKLIPIEEMPATDFSRPWVVTYTHSVDFSDKFFLTSIFRYQAKGKGLERLFGAAGNPYMIPDPDGVDTLVYETRNYSDTFNVDLSANAKIKFGKNNFTFGVDVLNLLNRKNDASVAYGGYGTQIREGYSMGRQLYANFRYEF